MKAKTAIVLALLMPLLAACGKGGEKGADKDKPETAQDQVAISTEDAEHLGIVTAPVQAVQYTSDVRGFGAVTSFDALAQSISDVSTSQAAAEQSKAALLHAKSLFADKLVTRDALALAERQAATDAAQVLLSGRKQAVAFGRNAPWRTKGESDAIFAQLSSGRLVLVHVSFPSSTPSQKVPQTLTIRRVQPTPGGSSWSAIKVWEAPADPNLPGWGFFALVANSDLAEGERVLALMPVGQPIAGIRIPAKAMLLNGNQAWCYTQVKPGIFVRHAIDISRPMDDGYFVQGGFAPGDQAVVQGESLLLARQLNPSSGDKD